MEDILCKGCKQKTEHYAKGLCQKCYTKQYMRDFFKKTKKKMVLVDNDLWIFLNKNKIKKDNGKLETFNDVIKRLIG